MYKLYKPTIMSIDFYFIKEFLSIYKMITNFNYQNHQCWNSSQMITDSYLVTSKLLLLLIPTSKSVAKINALSTSVNYKMQSIKSTRFNKLFH